MKTVYLGLGSNIDRHKYITAALDALQDFFGELQISAVYESKSVGFNGSNFYNMVVGIVTELSIADLSNTLKKIEDDNGRSRSGPKFSPRTLDIDILTYADFTGVEAGVEIPRREIIQNAFVLLPLAEIAGDKLHPQFGKSYAELWQLYDKNLQSLWAIDFVWKGKTISHRICN